jgi:adenylate cyclase
MPDLIAQGTESHHRWRRRLNLEHPAVIGRQELEWATPWDDKISRRHLRIAWRDGQWFVERLPEGRNPVFYRGHPVDLFALRPGEHFVVGATTFSLVDEPVALSLSEPTPVAQQLFDTESLRQRAFDNPDRRIEVLSRLPELISGAASDNELCVRLVNLLLVGVPGASAAAILERAPAGDGEPQVKLLHWDQRTIGRIGFAPSARLIHEALSRRQSVLHIWGGGSKEAPHEFTMSDDADWACCTPVPGESDSRWAIYLAGRFSTLPRSAAVELRDDVKFTEILATTLNNLRRSQQLVRRQSSLSQFFSPVVLEALSAQDPDVVLAPREADVSVLFCDLRGFALASQRSADDLLGLLQRVSRALGVMTRQILERGGVVGDFHGDSAMGFWGWPIAQPDAVERACLAALAIRAEFAAANEVAGHPLADFRIGIGIASGRSVAGKIGSIDQVKVTVFGPVVNLASRLEAMTKQLRAPILLDEATATCLRQSTSRDVARVRRVALVRPYGMDKAVDVSELLPPERDYPQLSAAHIASYEAAVDALLARDWQRAFQLLHHVPPEDRVKDFLTVFIAQHNRTPPADWDGVIPLATK